MERPLLSDRFLDALNYAATVHNGQVRKGTSIPYIAHLLAVCAVVLEHGGSEEEAIAALLHDTLEDHPETVTPDDLRRRFGDKVARIVGACSDTPPDYRGGPKPPWRERKTQYMQHLRREGSAFALVALADKLHSARAIVADHAQIGDQLWSRFSAGKEDQLWYFRELVGVFREVGVPNGMLEEFQRAVDKLERSARPA